MVLVAGRRSTLLPSELWRAPLRTVRPQDLADIYAQPRPEVARLVDQGVLHRVAHGYYIIVPPDYVGRTWLPGLEAAAAGIASSIYGPDQAIVMGISAARMLGAVPRALATAVIAVPSQHRPITLTDRSAQVRFVRRDTDALDAERVETPLGPALATTPEQTVLDLARRPELGNAEAEVRSAIATLYRGSDSSRLIQLAADQRLGAALRRVEGWVGHEFRRT
ncbi:type IV toxin-antitoxin system AbiEi family antitoxin [Nocardia sp. NPDC050406]|uniref:type IV toxin-antitoxin system AbiEi family antitoxin domain-containing protein n=1 Tax=Nocardia sp. NPDC050406 TaxID=3364318 RepID=UPI0037AF2CF7